MDDIQRLLQKSAEASSAGNFKDAYFLNLDIVEAATVELRKVKFIANVAITSPATLTILTVVRTSVANAQDILSKHNSALAEAPALPRKASLSRHTDRLYSGQTRSVTMLTEQLMASHPEHSSSNNSPVHSGASAQDASPVLSRISSFSSSVASPVTSPPLHRTTLPAIPSGASAGATNAAIPTIPPKPTRRPPVYSPTPGSNSPVLGFLENGASGFANGVNHGPGLGHSPTLRTESAQPTLSHHASNSHGHSHGTESPPKSKPPLPPKPARLFRKLEEIRAAEGIYGVDEDDDDDDDEDDDEEIADPKLLYPQTLARRASSPSIAIPTPSRRPGTPQSVPTSPIMSPSSLSSSGLSSLDRSRSYNLPQYSNSQQNVFISVIPEGCVDPTNLVEAERISGDNEDQLDQKTYGPSDHIPIIPVTPLRTTHRSLVEKEKTWSAKLQEARLQLQEKMANGGESTDEKSLSKQSDRQPRNSLDYQHMDVATMQENIQKYSAMIAQILGTVTKVRELLYRSASITSILEFPAYLVAYQLTLVESAIFLEIPPSALLSHSPKSPHRSITASTDFFNYLTRMIEYSILFPPEASGRAQCMHYWIKVAVKLHELENFQTLKAVLSALVTPPIKRLKRTWSFLPRKSLHRFEALSDMMSEARNYGKYRETMSIISSGMTMHAPASTVTSPGNSLSNISVNSLGSGSISGSTLNGNGSVNGSKFDALSGVASNLGIRAKEVARRPMVPFLGTFIMDITYLLAAVKTSSNSNSNSNSPAPTVSATSSLRQSTLSMATSIAAAGGANAPEDDPRVQDLLMTLSAYQSGPKYSTQPPRSYIKAATKNHHHFRAPSLSSALHRTAKYRTASVDRQIGSTITHQSSYEDEGDDIDGNGLRSTQQLILHYLLTRPWVPERMVDELSTIREVPKNKPGHSSTAPNSRISGGGNTNSIGNGSTASWSGLGVSNGAGGSGSLYSQGGGSAQQQRGSTGSNSGDANGSGGSSRPTSLDE